MFCSGPHRLRVTESALEPSTGDSEASALLASLPLESRGFSTPKAQFHPGDHFPPIWLVIVFIVTWSPCSDWFSPATKPAFPSLTQPDLDVTGLVHGFDPPLIGRCQEGHLVHISPTFTFVCTGHRGSAEGGAERNHWWEPGLPWVLEEKREDGLQNCCAGWGCFSHATFTVSVLLGLNNQE